jgi:hypothetical protein
LTPELPSNALSRGGASERKLVNETPVFIAPRTGETGELSDGGSVAIKPTGPRTEKKKAPKPKLHGEASGPSGASKRREVRQADYEGRLTNVLRLVSSRECSAAVPAPHGRTPRPAVLHSLVLIVDDHAR